MNPAAITMSAEKTYEGKPRWFSLIGRSLRDGPAPIPVYGWALSLRASTAHVWEALETNCGRDEPGRHHYVGRNDNCLIGYYGSQFEDWLGHFSALEQHRLVVGDRDPVGQPGPSRFRHQDPSRPDLGQVGAVVHRDADQRELHTVVGSDMAGHDLARVEAHPDGDRRLAGADLLAIESVDLTHHGQGGMQRPLGVVVHRVRGAEDDE